MGVVVCIVTYGDRWKYLERVLDRVCNDTLVTKVIVVDNASSPALRTRLQGYRFESHITLLELKENFGSARGFGDAIELASKTFPKDFIYLLDDDNLPLNGAIENAVKTWIDLGGDELICCLSHRTDRPEQALALSTGQRISDQRNSFMGFSWRNIFRKIKRTVGSGRKTGDLSDYVGVDFGPYGGLLFHASWVSRIGLPDDTYFVYADDHEYTYRIKRFGGDIVLLRDSVIDDIESSWYRTQNSIAAGILSESCPDFRLYYSVRNRVRFERDMLIDSLAVYAFNFSLYVSIQVLKGLAVEKKPTRLLAKLNLFLKAARAGWRREHGRSYRIHG